MLSASRLTSIQVRPHLVAIATSSTNDFGNGKLIELQLFNAARYVVSLEINIIFLLL